MSGHVCSHVSERLLFQPDAPLEYQQRDGYGMYASLIRKLHVIACLFAI